MMEDGNHNDLALDVDIDNQNMGSLLSSITQSFVKLEHFLKPFLKTRSHDGICSYFQIQSPIFGSAPKSFF